MLVLKEIGNEVLVGNGWLLHSHQKQVIGWGSQQAAYDFDPAGNQFGVGMLARVLEIKVVPQCFGGTWSGI